MPNSLFMSPVMDLYPKRFINLSSVGFRGGAIAGPPPVL